MIDAVNVKPPMEHHFEAYGFWAPSVGNYVQHRIMERMDHPRIGQLYRLVDPWYYRHRLVMPKFIVNGSGDQFFLPDSSQFYFDDLIGEKYLRYVPNTDHGLKGSDAIESITAFYSLIVTQKARPRFSWTEEDDGSIRVTTQDSPSKVLLWQATNPEARDFRIETLGPKYTSTFLQDQGSGMYAGRVNPPKKGWTAYYVELKYDLGPLALKLSTSVRVVPDILPYKGKLPNLPARITLICDAPDKIEAAAVVVSAAALANNELTLAEFRGLHVGRRCYFNWKPVTDTTIPDGRRAAKILAEFLEGQRCERLRLQLESGPGITGLED